MSEKKGEKKYMEYKIILIGNSAVGKNAFFKCTSLESISIPDSVKSIGEYAFGNCTSLTSISILDSIKSIGDGAFYNCAHLTSIKIPDSVKSIRSWTFDNCTSLKSISIPDSVESIGHSAFHDCTSLKEVVFKGKTLEEVQAMDFYPWGIKDESVIKAEKSLNESKYDKQVHFWAHMLDEAFVK